MKNVSTPKAKHFNPLVIALMGPTASGKTELAIELAEKLGLQIVNVDSRQLYIGMNIGTAKPTLKEQNRVFHHLLDLRQPNQPITVQEFKRIAEKKIDEILKSHQIAFLVGGSGLYLKSIVFGLQPPAVSPQPILRNQLEQLGQKLCYQLLSIADPAATKRIAPNDFVRTQRALEVIYSTGAAMTLQQKTNPPPWRLIEIGLDPANLNNRIALRTEKMYSNGLIEETRNLAEQFGTDLPMLQTIGYGEALQVIKGQISQNQAIEKTRQRTKQFAKRQRTWFRKQHQPNWLNGEEPLREALSMIESVLG